MRWHCVMWWLWENQHIEKDVSFFMYVCVLLIEIPSRPQKIFTSSRSFCLSLSIVDFSWNCANTQMKFDLCNGNLWPGYFLFAACIQASITYVSIYFTHLFISTTQMNIFQFVLGFCLIWPIEIQNTQNVQSTLIIRCDNRAVASNRNAFNFQNAWLVAWIRAR